MRVGLVLPGFSADAADWCIPALRHFGRALATTDDVRVVAVRYPYRAGRYQVDGVDVLAMGGAARRGRATIDVWRRTLEVIRHEHQRRAFDVLHAFWATESGLLTALAGRRLRIPTLVSLAGGELVDLRDIGYGDQRRAWERLKVRVSLRLASAVSGGSRRLLQIAERHVALARLHRAPLGVPLALFAPAPATPTSAPRRVVHVGTLTPVKDQATLLRAFASVRRQQPSITLEMVGEGPLGGRLRALSRELGLAASVCWRGDVNHAALPYVYRSGSLFVLSSRHEAQAMVAVEAAACGLPVVGTRVGVIPELTPTSATVAPVGNAEALAAAVIHTSDDPAAAAFAHGRAREDFGLERCTTRFRTLYTSLVER